MGVLSYVYLSDNRKCPKNTFFCFWGLVMTILHDFPYLANRRSYKVGWHLKMTARMHLLWVFCNMHAPQTTGNAQKMSFSGLICNFKVPISRKLYVILDWLIFQNYQKTHVSISVSHNYTSRTNGTLPEKCPRTDFFLFRIQSEKRKIRARNNSVFGHFSRNRNGLIELQLIELQIFFLNTIFRISFETWHTIIYMEIVKNHRKTNFRIVGANFCKNLNLAVSLGIIQF